MKKMKKQGRINDKSLLRYPRRVSNPKSQELLGLGKQNLSVLFRIQRRRVKGFKMPANAIYVGRGSKWGNPFKLGGDMIYVDAGHRRKILDKWVLYSEDAGHNVDSVLKLFRELLINPHSRWVEDVVRERFIWMRAHLQELKGKQLACWCAPGSKCHADILIEEANKKTTAHV